MFRSLRRTHRLVILVLATSLAPVVAEGGEEATPPSGGPEAGTPRSRLTVSGLYDMQTYLHKNFFMGGTAGGATPDGYVTDFDAFWTQRLTLRPRFILTDNLNINLSIDMAHGVWGLDNETPERDRPGFTNFFDEKGNFFAVQLDWAYLAFRHPGTKTRWYIGRQRFALGRSIVLEADLPGVQVYRDFPGWGSTLALGFAKQWEGRNGLSDRRGIEADGTISHPDSRDTDLVIADWRGGKQDGSVSFNPFAAYYIDRGNADGATFLPQEEPILEARFRPNVTRATILGVAGHLRRGVVTLEAEFDYLKGVDRVRNQTSGSFETLDRNNGDIKGMNVFGRLTLTWPRFELAGTLAMGSGDPDPWNYEGNFNHLRIQGSFFVTEVWEDDLSMDERGLVPEGLGNSFTRGYRGLENTTLYQGAASYLLRPNLRLTGRFTVIRATEAVRPWYDANGSGVISEDEYGRDVLLDGKEASSTDLGSEISGRLDWNLDGKMLLSLRGGLLSSGPALGYLLLGTAKYPEDPFELQLGLTVPIPEFSLGG